MSRNRSLEEIQEDIRTLTRVPSEFIHAKLDELAEEVGELAKPNWIPCSERLAEDAVICCNKEGDMLIGFLEKSKTGYITCDDDGTTLHDCVAWMPLPEPYKGE